MSTVPAGLARITINAPHRRVDVAVPDAVPLAELLPELLAHAGPGLADDGERHGGWLLCRADGTALSVTGGLAGQGVRDGSVLHLVPARTSWPELEYDDVVEAIAADARRQGVAWSASATRATALSVAGVGLAAGLLPVLRSGQPLVAAFIAAVLILVGITAARAYADALTGAVLAGFALPFTAATGWLAAPSTGGGAGRLSLGSVALLLVSPVAAAGVAYLLRIFVAGAAAGLLGAVGGLVATVSRPATAAAVVLALLVVGVAAVPLLAIRLGRLPLPVVASVDEPPPDRARILAAVARADELLTGLLLGLSAAATAASLVLARSGDPSGIALVAVAATALLLRVRTFTTVRQRVPLIAAGVAGFTLLALFVHVDARWLAAAVPSAALAVAIAGARAATRPVSPYVGRAADLLDTLCVVAVLPLACAVAGLYGMFG
jgi:type VII secretion integral membrane protein EccD